MSGWIVAVALAQALDAGTSCAAFARGYVEGNRLLPTSCGAVVGIKAGITVASGVGLARVARSHRTAAKWVTVALMAVPVSAGLANLHTMRGRR